MAEFEFTVIDNNTGEYPDCEAIALNEEWAKHLIYCDIEGFYIGEDGNSVLIDDCGNAAFCSDGRFTVKFEALKAENPRTKPDPKALTLEELMAMHGKPVWVEYYQDKKYKGWFICGGYEWRQGHIVDWIAINGLQAFPCEDYGKEFICYDRDPGRSVEGGVD